MMRGKSPHSEYILGNQKKSNTYKELLNDRKLLVKYSTLSNEGEKEKISKKGNNSAKRKIYNFVDNHLRNFLLKIKNL